MSQPAPPYNERYEELYDALRMFQDHFKKLKEARVAEQQKRLAENQANQSKILEEWRACQKRDQIRIAEIEKEAAPRDKVRLAQLEEEEKKKQAAEDERQDLLRKIKEAKKQAAKDEREFRKDMRERNQIHVSHLPSLTPAYSMATYLNKEIICSQIYEACTSPESAESEAGNFGSEAGFGEDSEGGTGTRRIKFSITMDERSTALGSGIDFGFGKNYEEMEFGYLPISIESR